MKYTIYKITNKINGKIYIGKHQTDNPNDDYYGSGKAIKEAIKKYGKENFIKEILYIFDTEEEMNVKERKLITEEFIKREDTYNLGIGGEGGPHFKGKTHSNQSIQKMRESRKDFVMPDNARKKISEANANRVITDETKKKLSIAASIRNGKTKEEAEELYNLRVTPRKLTKSEAMTIYNSNPEVRNKKSEQNRKLHIEYNLDEIKKDFDNGMKPSEIKQKYNLSKNRYDHIRKTYL